MAGKYSALTAAAALRLKDNIKNFGAYVNGAGVDLSNVVLTAAEEHARKTAPVRKKEYPPSVPRTPGTLKRSIRIIRATAEKPGKIICDTWLWEWIEGWNARSADLKARTGRGLKVHRNVKKTRGMARFANMLKSDPRRVIGEPVERQIAFIRSEKRLAKAIEKAAERAAVKQ